MSSDYISFTPPKQGVSLSEYKKDEKPWDAHRAQAQTMEALLATSDDDAIQRLRDRIHQCSPWLIFAHTTPDERARTFKLHEATFCRVRTCPVCQWRRSLRHVARFMEAWPAIVAEHPEHRWIHLTLTVRNVSVTELREEIRRLNTAWKRLQQLKAFKTAVLGYVRNVEVTRSATGEAHPHMHVLLMVSKEYFKRKHLYIEHKEWRQMWRDAARLDYTPEVRVQAVPEKGTEAAVREILKYATKPEDFLADAEWLIQYIYQVHNLRFLSAGGAVRRHLSTEEPSADEMITPGVEDTTADGDVLALSRFDWNRRQSGYFAVGTKICVPANPGEEAAAEAPAPVRRGDWEAQKEAEAAEKMSSILEEMKQAGAGPSLEATLRASGDSWARKKAEARKQEAAQRRADAAFMEYYERQTGAAACREKRYQRALAMLELARKKE